MRGKPGSGIICKHRSTSKRKRYIPSDCQWCAHSQCQERDAWRKAEYEKQKQQFKTIKIPPFNPAEEEPE